MTNLQIVSIVLTSSFLGAIVTSFINWIIQSKNYKNEYYKKLLDKRIEAYEMIIFYIDQMKVIIDLGNGKTCHGFLGAGHEAYVNFNLSVALGTGKSFWLSSETAHHISTFNMFLHEEISNKIFNLENKDESLANLGIKHKELIFKLRLNIENQMQKDFKNLHNIEKFVKDIGHEYKYLVQSTNRH